MTDFVRVKLKLEYPGASLADFGWVELRDFMDALLGALASMPGEPDVTHMMPVAVTNGSVVPVVQMPREALPAFRKLQAGPRPRWTRDMHRATQPLYAYLRDRNATVHAGVRTLKPFTVPDGSPRWQRHEQTTMLGKVHRAGGHEGKVEIVFEHDGRVVCEAGPELAARIANHLYQPIYVEGECVRDAGSGALLRFRIEDFRSGAHVDPLEGLRRIHDLLGDALADFDADKALVALRR